MVHLIAGTVWLLLLLLVQKLKISSLDVFWHVTSRFGDAVTVTIRTHH